MKKELQDAIDALRPTVVEYEAHLAKGKKDVSDEIHDFTEALADLPYGEAVSLTYAPGKTLQWQAGGAIQQNRQNVLGLPVKEQAEILKHLPALASAIEAAMKKEMA